MVGNVHVTWCGLEPRLRVMVLDDENHGVKKIPSGPIIRSRRTQPEEALNELIQEVMHNERTQNGSARIGTGLRWKLEQNL